MTWSGRPALGAGRALLAEGARSASRDEPPAVVPSIPLAVGQDRATSHAVAASWLVTCTTRMGPVPPRMLRDRFGYGAEIDALLAANADGGRPVLPDAAMRLAEEVLVMGAFDEAVDRIEARGAAGADEVSLTLPFGLSEDATLATVDAVLAHA